MAPPIATGRGYPTATATRVNIHIPTAITKLAATHWPHTWASNTSNCHSDTRVHQPHPTVTTKLVGTNHIQLPQPHTWAPNTFYCHRHTRGRQPYPTATATRVGPQPHTTATAIHAGTKHIQLPSPNSWVPIIFNCHGHTLGHQTHPTATATHAFTNHIQTSPPNSWAQITSNCHSHTRGPQTYSTVTAIHVGASHIQLASPISWLPITPICHSHIRWHKPYPNAISKLVGTNHIQLPWPHTWAPTTFTCQSHLATHEFQLPPTYRGAPNTRNCHIHTRWHKPYPTGITKLVGTNHIKWPWPHTWVPHTFNCHRHTRRTQPYSTATATRVSTEPHPTASDTRMQAQSTSNWQHQTRGYQSHPLDMATHVGTKHIQRSPPYTWAPTTSNCYRHTRGSPTTSNCRSHTRRHKEHPTGITKLVGTIHIHLSWTHTWAPNTSNTSRGRQHSSGHQPHLSQPHVARHPTVPSNGLPHTWAPNIHTAYTWAPTTYCPHACTNHTQLPQPQTRWHQPRPSSQLANHITVTANSWVTTSNSHPMAMWTTHTRGHQTATLAQTTSNWHHQTHGYQSHPTGHTRWHKPHPTSTGKHGDTKYPLPPPYTWDRPHSSAIATHVQPTTSNCHRHTCGNHIQLPQPHTWPWPRPHTWARNTFN